MICNECLSLVTSLVNFSDRITRVQKLYCILQSTSSQETPNLQELRSKFGLLDDETLMEVHYVDKKPKLDDQLEFLPEESAYEFENPLTPEGRQEKEHEDQEQEPPEEGAEQKESEDQDPDYEADEDAVLLKLCDAYGIQGESSSSGSLSDSSPRQEKAGTGASDSAKYLCKLLMLHSCILNFKTLI